MCWLHKWTFIKTILLAPTEPNWVWIFWSRDHRFWCESELGERVQTHRNAARLFTVRHCLHKSAIVWTVGWCRNPLVRMWLGAASDQQGCEVIRPTWVAAVRTRWCARGRQRWQGAVSSSEKRQTYEFGWNTTGRRRWRIMRQSRKSTLSPPKSGASVKFVQRVHHLPALVKVLQGTNGGINPARSVHMPAHHRPQSQEGMGCKTAFHFSPFFFTR